MPGMVTTTLTLEGSLDIGISSPSFPANFGAGIAMSTWGNYGDQDSYGIVNSDYFSGVSLHYGIGSASWDPGDSTSVEVSVVPSVGASINLYSLSVTPVQLEIPIDGLTEILTTLSASAGALPIIPTPSYFEGIFSLEHTHWSTRSDGLSGDSNDNTIVGTSNDDVLEGGGGDDIIQGGTGNDTYIFYRNDGEDKVNSDKLTIQDGGNSSSDTLEIYDDDIWLDFNLVNIDGFEDILLSKSGENLKITIDLGGADLGWFGEYGKDWFPNPEGTVVIDNQGSSLNQIEYLKIYDKNSEQIESKGGEGDTIDLVYVWDNLAWDSVAKNGISLSGVKDLLGDDIFLMSGGGGGSW